MMINHARKAFTVSRSGRKQQWNRSVSLRAKHTRQVSAGCRLLVKISGRSTNMTGLGSYLDGVNSCMPPVIDPIPLLQCKVIYSADKALKHACESG